MSAIGLKAPKEEVWKIDISIPASSSAGSVITATVTRDATSGAENKVTCPSDEVWHIVDIFVKNAPSTDGWLIPFVGGFEQDNILLGATVVTNSARVKLAKTIVILPTKELMFKYKLAEASGSSDETVTAYVKVVRYPVS